MSQSHDQIIRQVTLPSGEGKNTEEQPGHETHCCGGRIERFLTRIIAFNAIVAAGRGFLQAHPSKAQSVFRKPPFQEEPHGIPILLGFANELPVHAEANPVDSRLVLTCSEERYRRTANDPQKGHDRNVSNCIRSTEKANIHLSIGIVIDEFKNRWNMFDSEPHNLPQSRITTGIGSTARHRLEVQNPVPNRTGSNGL
ncbi:MAG: hypothetical protein ABFS37_17010 [Acidobacteriota bacterium]